jgi:hypothetical protein
VNGLSTGRELIAEATRTLLAFGCDIAGAQTQPGYVELRADLPTAFGSKVGLLLVITDEPSFGAEQIESIRRSAKNQSRSALIVASMPGTDWMSHQEFFDSLGGAVPSWRALEPTYAESLAIAARNEVPPGFTGEAWLAFEDIASDGVEYVTGRRVRRLGGRRRGRPVSDSLAQLPDLRLLVLDAKASAGAVDVSLSALRPLHEYTIKQIQRQHGQNEVFGALVVAPTFQQDAASQATISAAFNSDVGVPVAFLGSETLIDLVRRCADDPTIRAAVWWHRIFKGGAVLPEDIRAEFADAHAERIRRA